MTEHVEQAPPLSPEREAVNRSGKSTLPAAGGILGAIGASSCCIIPFVVFGMGPGGAWLGDLMTLAPYQPYFIVFALVSLGTGFNYIYRKPEGACGDACEPQGSRVATKMSPWAAAVWLTAAIAYPYVAPLFMEI